MASLHKQGYDEIILTSYSDEQLKIIEDLIENLFIGFIIKEKTKLKVIVGQIAITDSTEFDSTLRRTFRQLITMCDELYESLVKMRENAGEEPQDKETEIMKYLKMCRFYPVSFGEGSATNPEIAKIDAMNRFKNYVQSQADKLNIRLAKKIENEISNKFVPMIGFSDDDPRNIAAMSKGVKDVKIFSTYGGKKKLYKPDETELQLEYKIKYILKNIIK